MARSRAGDDDDLRMACAAAIGGGEKVVLAVRVAKSRGFLQKLSLITRPRVLSLATKYSPEGEATSAFIHVLKYSSGGALKAEKVYKLNHLIKLEVVSNDPRGSTFILGFDNLRIAAPPQWTVHNLDDRNIFLLCVLNICQDIFHSLPRLFGIDFVELTLWGKENIPSAIKEMVAQDGLDTTFLPNSDLKLIEERDLFSPAEEMEDLLGMYVIGIGEVDAFSERLKLELITLEATNAYALLESQPLLEEVVQGLEAATVCIDDIDEWLRMINDKLKNMREDIALIESRNSKFDMHLRQRVALDLELEKLLERLHMPSEFAASLTEGSFNETHIVRNIKACQWLTNTLRGLEVPNLDSCYEDMRAVKEKQVELEKLKSTLVKRASDFLKTYFVSLVDSMISVPSNFSQRGNLRNPEHTDMQYKFSTYKQLLWNLKSLDKNCLEPLRKAYCQSVNSVLRRQVRQFASELRASTMATRKTTRVEISTGSNETSEDASNVPKAYSKMLEILIPYLEDEVLFSIDFLCFEVSALAPLIHESKVSDGKFSVEDDSNPMNPDGDDVKQTESEALNLALHELLDGTEEDFSTMVDWAYEIDAICCISMLGITLQYFSRLKADSLDFVSHLLNQLESKITRKFIRFVDKECQQIERTEQNVKQVGVIYYIPRFADLATEMEQYVDEHTRILVDKAYAKLVSTMFLTLEKIVQTDPKHADVALLENYAAFQDRIFDLANSVPTLSKFYHQASEAYDQACTRYISMITYTQFEKLFQFSRRIEDQLINMYPEEIPTEPGFSNMDLRKVVDSSLSGINTSINAMYKRLQKHLTSHDLLPPLWNKCKKALMEKYESFIQLVVDIYPEESERMLSVDELRKVLDSI